MAGKQDFKIEALKPKHETVAIVGRPNVGKSALFNLIIGRRMAIVHEMSGVTRDRVASMADYENRRFMVVDTGGLGFFKDDRKADVGKWDELIKQQLEVALESAQKVIFVLDARDGLQPLDEEVARLLHESDKEVFVVANKADNPKLEENIDEFAGLGFESVRPISCTQRTGVRDLLHELTQHIPEEPEEQGDAALKIAVVGRPNVGKSSIINRLLGEERVIVSDIAGTTRDAIDIPFTVDHEGKAYHAELVDTAGIKRKGKIDTAVDFFSMARTENAIKRSDIVLVVLDAANPATAQDRKICRVVADAGKACMVLLNKWDLASADVKQRELMHELEYELPFMRYAEKMTCCAVSGYNLKHVMPKVMEMVEQFDVEFPTSLVNRVISDATMRLPPPHSAKGQLKVYYATCVSTRPPTFRLFVNYKERCPANYQTYLKNQFIQAFGIYGMPVIVDLRNRRSDEDRPDYVPPPKSKRSGSSASKGKGSHRPNTKGKKANAKASSKGSKKASPKPAKKGRKK